MVPLLTRFFYLLLLPFYCLLRARDPSQQEAHARLRVDDVAEEQALPGAICGIRQLLEPGEPELEELVFYDPRFEELVTVAEHIPRGTVLVDHDPFIAIELQAGRAEGSHPGILVHNPLCRQHPEPQGVPDGLRSEH